MAVATEQTKTGEVRIETGSGLIEKLEHDDGKRNARVHIKATHTNLRELVTGWVDTFDSSVWPFAREAFETGQQVDYRVEVHRKADIDPKVPLADVPKRSKVRDLVVLTPKGQLPPREHVDSTPQAAQDRPTPPQTANGANYDPEAESDGKTVLQAGREATAQRAAHRQAPPSSPPEDGARSEGASCDLCQVSYATSAELLEHAGTLAHRQRAELAKRGEATAAATTFDADAPDVGGRPVPPRPSKGPRRPEGKPWDAYNEDGTLNLASYAFTAVVGFVELAHDLASYRARDVMAETGEAVQISMKQVRSLAAVLLGAADQAQAKNRRDGQHDRMDMSHTRARGAVRTALKVYPVPWGADAAQRAAWAENLTNHAAEILAVSFDLFQQHEQG